MNSLKASALKSLALHCGYRSGTTKLARLVAAQKSLDFANRLLRNCRPQDDIRVLSVDVGIKHFSYSKVAYAGSAASIDEWSVLNLHDRFGGAGLQDNAVADDNLADAKAYMAHLALSVVDSVFLQRDWVPHIITIENQRTRSNSNQATLPNVLLNFTLEQMLYAAFAARQSAAKHLQGVHVVPMNSNKMVNFWLSRFVAPLSKIPSAKSKQYRTNLVYSWLAEPSLAPFDIASFSLGLPSDFASQTALRKKASLKAALGLEDSPVKVDDLVDSFLYNMTMALQLQRHRELQSGNVDLAELIAKWDRHHHRYLHGLVAHTGLELEPLP